VVYGAIFLIFSVIAIPVFLLAPPDEPEGFGPSKASLLFMIILYPLVGAGMGWVTGQIGARIYNRVAARFGGILFETRKVDPSVNVASVT